MLYLLQTQRIGPASQLKLREEELDRAAEALAECLGSLLVRDGTRPGEPSRAPQSVANLHRGRTMDDDV
jgi:hypothetical protein